MRLHKPASAHPIHREEVQEDSEEVWRSCQHDTKPHLLVRDLQQLQHHGVSPHVPQESLLLLPALPHRGPLLHAELAEPQQDLQETLALEPDSGFPSRERQVPESSTRDQLICRSRAAPGSPSWPRLHPWHLTRAAGLG